MSWPIDYLVQFAPVAIGAVIMLLLKEIRPREAKIKLVIREGVQETDGRCQDNCIRMGGASKEFTEELHWNAFKQRTYDELILKGLLKGNFDGRSTAVAAFERLGMLAIDDVHRLNTYLVKSKPESLRIYSPCHAQLMRNLLSYYGQSGLLLAYLADYRLEVMA